MNKEIKSFCDDLQEELLYRNPKLQIEEAKLKKESDLDKIFSFESSWEISIIIKHSLFLKKKMDDGYIGLVLDSEFSQEMREEKEKLLEAMMLTSRSFLSKVDLAGELVDYFSKEYRLKLKEVTTQDLTFRFDNLLLKLNIRVVTSR